MFDDIVIGTGHAGTSWTAYEMWGDISRNSVSHLVHLKFLDLTVTVFNNTPTGVELKAKVKAGVPEAEILEWMTEVIFPRVDPKLLRKKIDEAIEEAFERGRNAKAMEVRKVLGI